MSSGIPFLTPRAAPKEEPLPCYRNGVRVPCPQRGETPINLGGGPPPPVPVPSRDAVAGIAPPPVASHVRGQVDAALRAKATADLKEQEKEQLKAQAAVAADAERSGAKPGPENPKTADEPRPAPAPDRYPFDTVIVDGREVIATPDRAAALVAAGGRYRKPDERMPAGGVRTEAFLHPVYGKASGYPVPGVPGGRAGSAFVQANYAPSSVPFSEQLRNAPMPETDLKAKGGWTFRGGYAETGKPGPREGTGKLSGIEQALSLREWREGRVREEQARELGDIEQQVKRAQAEYALRQAEIDPLAVARIQAEGRYGGDVLRYQTEAASREAALNLYRPFVEQILSITPPERQAEVRMQLAAALANIALGQAVRDPRQDPMSYLMGMMGAATGATAAAPKT